MIHAGRGRLYAWAVSSGGSAMRARTLAFLTLATAAGPAFATTPVPILSAPVPGLGLIGVIATAVAALVIGWWRMRK